MTYSLRIIEDPFCRFTDLQTDYYENGLQNEICNSAIDAAAAIDIHT
jgi:hypothetical protein